MCAVVLGISVPLTMAVMLVDGMDGTIRIDGGGGGRPSGWYKYNAGILCSGWMKFKVTKNQLLELWSDLFELYTATNSSCNNNTISNKFK